MKKNEFFGADEKYVPKEENKENVKETKRGMPKLLIGLLIGIPILIFVIVIIIVITTVKTATSIGSSIIEKGQQIQQSTQQSVIEAGQQIQQIQQNAQQSVKKATEEMSSQEIQMFNSMFEAYGGEQRGASVKALITLVTTSNSSNNKVELEGITKASEVVANSKYNINLKYDDATGYINKIIISLISE